MARSSVDLANQTLKQARDRFAAGVTDNLEVVQAQESLASANESYISSLYAHNLAKISLAKAIGFAEEGVRQYLQNRSSKSWQKIQTRSVRDNQPQAQRPANQPAPLPASDRDLRWKSFQAGNPRFRVFLIVGIVVLLVAGFFLWRYFASYEDTDDAQIDGHLNSISARVSGHVLKLLVDDNQYVAAGTPLFEIDPKDYQVAVDRAKADYADAVATGGRRAGERADHFRQHQQPDLQRASRCRECKRRNRRGPPAICRCQCAIGRGSSQQREGAERSGALQAASR